MSSCHKLLSVISPIINSSKIPLHHRYILYDNLNTYLLNVDMNLDNLSQRIKLLENKLDNNNLKNNIKNNDCNTITIKNGEIDKQI